MFSIFRSIINVDCLLDAIQALVADCDHSAIRKIKNVDAFVNRCKFFRSAGTCRLVCLSDEADGAQKLYFIGTKY